MGRGQRQVCQDSREVNRDQRRARGAAPPSPSSTPGSSESKILGDYQWPSRSPVPCAQASFRLSQRMRTQDLLPKCGKPLVITSAGVAKRGEGVAVEPAPGRQAAACSGSCWRCWCWWRWCPAAWSWFFVRGEPDTQKQLSEKDSERPQPKLDHQEQTGAPPVSPTREGDLGPEVKVGVQKELAELPPKLLVPDMPARTPTRRPTVIEQKHFTDMAFSPNSKMLATANWEGTVNLWDAATGKSLKTFGSREGVSTTTSIAFSPDGKTLVSSTWDGKADGR